MKMWRHRGGSGASLSGMAINVNMGARTPQLRAARWRHHPCGAARKRAALFARVNVVDGASTARMWRCSKRSASLFALAVVCEVSRHLRGSMAQLWHGSESAASASDNSVVKRRRKRRR